MGEPAFAAAPEGRRAGVPQGITLAIAGFLPILTIVSLAPAVPTLIAHFHDVPNAGLIIPLLVTTPGLMVALLSPLAGVVADRFGRRTPLLLATFLYAFAGAAPVFIGSFSAVLASRICVGIAETFILVIVNALFADYYEPRRRRTWITVQGLLGPALGTASITSAGWLASIHWSSVFWIYALAAPVFLAALIWCFEPGRHALAGAASSRSDPPSRFPWRIAAVYSTVTLFSSIIYYVFIVQGGLAFEAIGLKSSTQIGAIIGSANLGILLGAALFNLLSRRLSGAFMIATYLVLLGIGTGGMGLSTSVTLMTIFAFVQEIGAGMTVTALIFWVSHLLPPAHRGRGFGFWTGAFFAGQFISPAIVGLIGAAGGGLLASFRLLGLLSIVAAVAIALAARYLPQPIEDGEEPAGG